MSPLITREPPFVSELVFGVNIFDLDIWFHSLIIFKDVQLRLALEKNVCLWVRCPHLTTEQHLGCSFQLLGFIARMASNPAPASWS